MTPFHADWSPTLSTRYDRRQNQGISFLSVPTFYAPFTSSENRARLIGLGIGVLFGGIHCVAWSFSFISVAERCIWRISAVNVTVLPIIIAASIISITNMRVMEIIRYTLFPCTVLYWISRVTLLILPIIDLRSLPPGSLVDFKWSAFIPHI